MYPMKSYCSNIWRNPEKTYSKEVTGLIPGDIDASWRKSKDNTLSASGYILGTLGNLQISAERAEKRNVWRNSCRNRKSFM